MTWGTSPWGVAALAPGELADTVTCGGAMFGYDSTPRPLIASTPPSVIRLAMTQATTGWWMKKRDMGDQSFCAASPACASSAALSAGAGWAPAAAAPAAPARAAEPRGGKQCGRTGTYSWS